MRFTQLFISEIIRRGARTIGHASAKRPQLSASAFVLESLENRVLLSATPVATGEMATSEPTMTAAVVTTDKPDYAPGETAVITTTNTSEEGLKFGDGEMVEFQVTRTDGVEDYPMGNVPWYVTDGVGGFDPHQEYDAHGQAVDRNADGMADWIRPDNDGTVNGSISTNWFVEDQYLGASLRVTATGQDSGAVATTEFTDALSITSLSQSSGTTLGGTSITITGAGYTPGQEPLTVSFDGGTTFVSATRIDNTHLTATTPAHSAGTFNVIVQDKGGAPGATLVNGFTYVNAATTTTTVSSSASTSTYGDSVTFTAIVNAVSGSAAPTGSVEFFDGATSLGSDSVANSTGTGTSTWSITTSSLNAGTHSSIRAVYTATGSFTGSTSANFTQTVNKADATVNVTGYTGTYDAAAHHATGTATGVGGVDLSAGLNLGASFTDAPGGTANWSFSGGTNYNNQNGSVAIVIAKADLTITAGSTTKVFGQTINLADIFGTTINTGVNGENLGITYSSMGNTVTALVGSYAINGSVSNGTGMLSNYNVTITPGTLTVATPSVITTVQDGVNLLIVGTGGYDTIVVNANNPSAITVNGTGSYSVGAGGHVIVYGMACDDNISLIGNVNLEAHGGMGNDTITGGAGQDVIWGDQGNDTLTGSAGNDVLVGGSGSDRLVGSAGHDLLISGELTGDHNGGAYDYTALRAIDDSWAANWSADSDLESTSGDVVDESGSADQLTGSSGHDWFILGSTDKITDINSASKDSDKISYS